MRKHCLNKIRSREDDNLGDPLNVLKVLVKKTVRMLCRVLKRAEEKIGLNCSKGLWVGKSS